MQKSLRGALVGYGFISEKGHAPEYQSLCSAGAVEIVAVADICQDRRQAAGRTFPGVRQYESHLDLLRNEREIDFVDIAAPPYAHAEIAYAALARGLHVLCEKPLAVNGRQARALAQHAERSGRVLFPCHNYRHAPVIKTVRSALASGAIGPVTLVTLQTFRTTHARGVDEWLPDWRRDRRIAGGGIAMDHGSHTLYLAFEWMRSYPHAVTAKLQTIGRYDTEDNFSCTLTFPTGIATTHLTWTAGVRKVLYTLHGEQGAITVDDDAVTVHRRPRTGSQTATSERVVAASHWMDASHKEWFGSLFADFRDAISNNTFVGSQTLDAIRCVETIDAAYASAALGSREVLVNPDRTDDVLEVRRLRAVSSLEHRRPSSA
jgi:predicted dehydrogenase